MRGQMVFYSITMTAYNEPGGKRLCQRLVDNIAPKKNPFLLPYLTIPNLLTATEKPSHTDYTHFCTALWDIRALTPLFGNGAGAFRIGKNSVVLINIGKKYKVLCIEVFIVRLI